MCLLSPLLAAVCVALAVTQLTVAVAAGNGDASRRQRHEAMNDANANLIAQAASAATKTCPKAKPTDRSRLRIRLNLLHAFNCTKWRRLAFNQFASSLESSLLLLLFYIFLRAIVNWHKVWFLAAIACVPASLSDRYAYNKMYGIRILTRM